jgi:hypothetical protein
VGQEVSEVPCAVLSDQHGSHLNAIIYGIKMPVMRIARLRVHQWLLHTGFKGLAAPSLFWLQVVSHIDVGVA